MSGVIASGITQEYGRPYLSFMGNTPSNPTSCVFPFCTATMYFGVKASEEKVGSRSAHQGMYTEYGVCLASRVKLWQSVYGTWNDSIHYLYDRASMCAT